jgi:hypothetical protein
MTKQTGQLATLGMAVVCLLFATMSEVVACSIIAGAVFMTLCFSALGKGCHTTRAISALVTMPFLAVAQETVAVHHPNPDPTGMMGFLTIALCLFAVVGFVDGVFNESKFLKKIGLSALAMSLFVSANAQADGHIIEVPSGTSHGSWFPVLLLVLITIILWMVKPPKKGLKVLTVAFLFILTGYSVSAQYAFVPKEQTAYNADSVPLRIRFLTDSRAQLEIMGKELPLVELENMSAIEEGGFAYIFYSFPDKGFCLIVKYLPSKPTQPISWVRVNGIRRI